MIGAHLCTRTLDPLVAFAFYALFVPFLCGLVWGAFMAYVAAGWNNEPFSPVLVLLFAVTEPYRYAGGVAIISGLIAGAIVAHRGRLSVLHGIMATLAGYPIAGIFAAALGIRPQREILGSGFEFTEPVLWLLGIIPHRFRQDDPGILILLLGGRSSSPCSIR